MSVQTMPAALVGERPFTLLEQMQRISAASCFDATERSNMCASMAHVGIFFDGTNNNKKRDQEDVKDANMRSHSNVVVLHDAFKDAPDEGYYRFYVPGVGTPFDKVGEPTETPDGKAMAKGGDARINWAMIQLLNAMKRSMCSDERLVPEAQVGADAIAGPLHASQNTGSNLEGKRRYFGGLESGKLSQLERVLAAKAEAKPSKKLLQVNVSVFGFSRGAAQARAFCHFVHHLLLKKGPAGGYTLAGVPFRFQFLGLFDSVASVGMADASPFWRGLGGWANGTLDIVPSVERTVHFCAAHEIRINFPLSTGRIGDKGYPANCAEMVYPGAHSDVGGGYAPGCQGKAVGSRTKLLSQVPLLEMYREAQRSMVPLLTIEQLQKVAKGDEVANDLKIDPDCARLFNAYREFVVGFSGTIEEQMRGHVQLYWRWRMKYLNDPTALPSHARAVQQDRIDICESNGDFYSDMAEALMQVRRDEALARTAPNAPSGLTPAQRDFLRVRSEAMRPDFRVPREIDEFFDQLVHDSHASFYMVGPVTDFDRKEKIAMIQRKVEWTAKRLEGLRRGDGSGPQPTSYNEARPLASLSDLERRIHEHQTLHQGEFPALTDEDREQLLAMETVGTSAGVRSVTNKTRRELGGHVRYRRVFDKS
ncbi:uncharacterized protein (DUF2235 family) [Variovorax sp. OAS795]|uniref:T6SS phospholipase effector Tle1-like catalytic domain-containing protein n=1 Tax=Variovorax sp. OAS795 TaxID=3034231 RepID=UPI0033954ED9